MNPIGTVLRICRACGQRSASSLRSNPASTRTNLQHSRMSQHRSLSSAKSRRMQPSSNTLPSESSAAPLPESMLPTTAPSQPTFKSTQSSSTQQLPNPFPPLDPSLNQPTTIGTVSHIHTRTAYITRIVLQWEPRLQKYYKQTAHDLVHDPLSLLHVGDIVKYSRFTPSEVSIRKQRDEDIDAHLGAKGIDTGKGEKVTNKGFVVPEGRRLVMVGAKLEAIHKKQRTSKGVRFVVREVVTPFGSTIAHRVEKGEMKKAGWLEEWNPEAKQVVSEEKEAARQEIEAAAKKEAGRGKRERRADGRRK